MADASDDRQEDRAVGIATLVMFMLFLVTFGAGLALNGVARRNSELTTLLTGCVTVIATMSIACAIDLIDQQVKDGWRWMQPDAVAV